MRALYLHWGPGGNAEIERRWHGSSLAVDWWDQPSTRGASALDNLFATAREHLKQLAQERSAPVQIIAHSFGGQIARNLAQTLPEKIAGITLLACGYSPTRAFVHLARRLGQEHPQLAELANRAEKSGSADDFWAMAGAITQVPDFQKAYWMSASLRKRYLELADGVSLLDFGTFQDVMSRFAGHPENTQPIHLPPGIQVRCLMGIHDPLQDLGEEEAAWKRIFPGCATERLEAGHFIPFEISSAKWMPPTLSFARRGN